jgi:hypothetical protein
MFPTVPEALWQELASEFKMEEFRELLIPRQRRRALPRLRSVADRSRVPKCPREALRSPERVHPR